MPRYRLETGTRSGLRAVDTTSAATVVFAGRLLDNMTVTVAKEILALLEHNAAVQDEHEHSLDERGDIAAIFDRRGGH